MIKIKKVRPLFTSIVTTMDRYEKDLIINGIIQESAGSIKDIQTVIAVGDAIRNIQVGDKVHIDPIAYAVKKHQEGSLKDGIITDNPVIKYNFNIIEINEEPCLLLRDRDIDYIVEESEEIQTSSIIVDNTPTIIA